MYKIISPLQVQVTKKKKFILNLNQYRNTCFFILNKAKIEYQKQIWDQLKYLPQFNKIELEYVVYPKDKRKFDLDNVCSIHAKFFQDSLVGIGCIKDDNYEYVISSRTCFGGIDKLNPRVEILIKEIK